MLDVNKGAGPDEIPPSLLKSCCSSFVEPLYILFNWSLACGIFPFVWKRGIVVPIYKDGNKNDVVNYRPITILNTIAKIFESIIHDDVYRQVDSLIIESQHGFVRGKSVLTNLSIYSDFVLNNFEKGLQVDVVYTDFAKAFDKVDHGILLAKLEALGFSPNLITWIESYLKDRTLSVRIKHDYSNIFSATSGVPQGSNLGPLFFVLFINDINFIFKFCKYSLFADDLKLFIAISNECDYMQLQYDLNQLLS